MPFGDVPFNPEPAATARDRDEDSSGARRLGEYWADTRPLRAISLEGLMSEHGLDFVDVLKLDCEGCELAILDQCQVLDNVGLIVGEFHGRQRFLELVAERLGDWKLEILRDGDPGTFWLTNPRPRPVGTAAGAAAPASPVPSNLSPIPFLRIHGRPVEMTAHHALRFARGPDGGLVPVLYFRGREVLQPWSLQLANEGSGIREHSNAVVRDTRNDASALPAIQNPIQPSADFTFRSKSQNSNCRHLGAEKGLRDCPSCRGNVRVKVFTCEHPSHAETTLAECGACPDYVETQMTDH